MGVEGSAPARLPTSTGETLVQGFIGQGVISV